MTPPRGETIVDVLLEGGQVYHLLGGLLLSLVVATHGGGREAHQRSLGVDAHAQLVLQGSSTSGPGARVAATAVAISSGTRVVLVA